MSPHAYALTLASRTLARPQPAERIPRLQALLRYCAENLLHTGPACVAQQPAPQPSMHRGHPVMVLWAQGGTPAQVGAVWCEGTFLGVVGQGEQRQYLVRSTTPRHPQGVVRAVAPQSVRFVAAAPARAQGAA